MLTTSSSLLTLTALGLLQLQAALGLSEDMCTTVSAIWASNSPRLQGVYPYYDLLLSCTGALNIEGRGVDSCVRRGASCGQAGADAFCAYIGFDGAHSFTTASALAPVRSLTGEWCLQPGTYEDLGALNRTAYETLASASAASLEPRCQKLESVACFRSRQTLGRALDRVQAAAGPVAAPAPAPVDQPAQAPVAEGSFTALGQVPLGLPVGAKASRGSFGAVAGNVGGRRLLLAS